jgi:hypothetical protein
MKIKKEHYSLSAYAKIFLGHIDSRPNPPKRVVESNDVKQDMKLGFLNLAKNLLLGSKSKLNHESISSSTSKLGNLDRSFSRMDRPSERFFFICSKTFIYGYYTPGSIGTTTVIVTVLRTDFYD